MTVRDNKSIDALAPDFQDFIAMLCKHDVDVVLVGGYAMGVHGIPRATGDIDFLYRRNAKNVKRLVAALEEFGAPRAIIDQSALLRPSMVTQFGRPPVRIDLLNEIDGVTATEVWKGAATITIDRHKLRVIGLSQLLKNKRAAGREKDKDDVRRLEARQGRKLPKTR